MSTEAPPTDSPFTAPAPPSPAPGKRKWGYRKDGTPYPSTVKAKAKVARRGRPPGTGTTTGAGGGKKDLSQGLSLAYATAGGIIAFRDPPVGKVMQLQAPSAGKELYKVVREHPALHSILSPIFGQTEVMSLSKVIGPPLLIAMVERRPELMPMLEPILMPLLFEVFRDATRLAKAQREQFAELADQTDEETRAAFEAFLGALFEQPSAEDEPVETEAVGVAVEP